MTPKSCYEDTSARARQFLRLYRGLKHNRQRRTKSDWASRCKQFFNWPQATSLERVNTADAVIIFKDSEDLSPDDFTADALRDLLRSALVFGVSAFDRYLHERVTKTIVTALRQGHLNKSQREFSIPVSVAIQITDAVAKARRDNREIRPANEVRKAVQELLHKRPLQSWREMSEAMRLIGISGLDGQLQQRYRVANLDEIRNTHARIIHRRNSIVHEGDIVVHQRGGTLQHREILPGFVSDSLDHLDTLVEHLDGIHA